MFVFLISCDFWKRLKNTVVCRGLIKRKFKLQIFNHFSPRDYATVVAISSIRLSDEEMKRMTGHQMAGKSWIRLLSNETLSQSWTD